MNVFEEFVDGSDPIQDNLAAIRARQIQREQNSVSYVAQIEQLREEMMAMEAAFKDVVYKYTAILPDGWRVTGDFDKWVAGKACVGFVRGAMNPTDELMVGGNCDTVADIEMTLDRLYHFLANFYS